MSDERRYRYAAAIEDGAGPCARESDLLGAAEAAMAVSDAEQRSLRAEVDGLDEALRGLISASEKDNARLRAEVKLERKGRETLEGVADSAISERNTAEATIERVRAVLTRVSEHAEGGAAFAVETLSGSEYSDVEEWLRAALDGNS